MKQNFEYKGNVIEYTLCRSRRKTIGISISAEKGIKVSVPYKISEAYVQSVLLKKGEWIVKKLRNISETALVNRKYVSGESIPVLGADSQLNVLTGYAGRKPLVIFDGNEITVHMPANVDKDQCPEVTRDALAAWFKNLAQNILNERVELFSNRLGVIPGKLFFKSQKTIWGSCSKANNININWRIVMAPIEIVDYLVVHELAHIRMKNHSKSFWNIVESILPDHKQRRKWLKSNGHKLFV